MIEFSMGVIEFEQDLEEYAKTIKQAYLVALKRAAKFLSDEIINNSPYDKGKFLASHKVNFNWVNEAVHTGEKITKQNARTIAKKEQAKIENLNEEVVDNITTIWFSNNVPYALALEYGLYGSGPKTVNGYSKQAPKGIYRLAVQSTEARLQEIIKKAEMEEMRHLKDVEV